MSTIASTVEGPVPAYAERVSHGLTGPTEACHWGPVGRFWSLLERTAELRAALVRVLDQHLRGPQGEAGTGGLPERDLEPEPLAGDEAVLQDRHRNRLRAGLPVCEAEAARAFRVV
jgi:hypothetical protein